MPPGVGNLANTRREADVYLTLAQCLRRWFIVETKMDKQNWHEAKNGGHYNILVNI